jgi:hypothetical protein
MKNKLIKLANHLDNIGLHNEASYLDSLIKNSNNAKKAVANKALEENYIRLYKYSKKLEERVFELEDILEVIQNPYKNSIN